MMDAYSQIPLHSSAPLNPTPYGYDGPPLASRILYGDATAVTKLMDGIFLGGIEAGQDLEFCAAHKITHIINCSGSSDILSQYGLKYLSLRWLEGSHGPGSVMFDPQGRNIQRIFKFIESVRAKGEGILIHSMDGNSRAIGVMMAYLMRKFKWGMTKCLEYIRLKRPHIHPSPILLKQLARAAQYLNLNPNDQQTTFQQRWMQQTPGMTTLEVLLHNTFMNGHAIPVHAPGTEPTLQQQRPLTAKKKKIVWIDETTPPSPGTGSGPASTLKRTSLRRSLDADEEESDDEEEEDERNSSQRLMHKALGVHYNSNMMNPFGGANSSQYNPNSPNSLIRPPGATYGPKQTPPEIKHKPLLKMGHLQPHAHFSWSIVQNQQNQNNNGLNSQPQQSQPTPPSPHRSSHSSLPPPSPTASQHQPQIPSSPSQPPQQQRPPSTIPPPTPPQRSILAPSPLNGARPLASTGLAPVSLGPGLMSTNNTTTTNTSTNLRSAWTPEKELSTAARQQQQQQQQANGNGNGNYNEPALPSPSSTPSPQPSFPTNSYPPSSSTSSAPPPPFTKSVPGKPVVPSYRPANVTTTSSTMHPGSSPSPSLNSQANGGSGTLRSSSSVDEITDNLANSNLTNGAAPGSRRTSINRPGTPGALTLNSSSSNNAGQLTPTSSTSALGYSSVSSSPASTPTASTATSTFANGLVSRPLRQSRDATPTSSTSSLASAASSPTAATVPSGAASGGGPSPYSFMSSPALANTASSSTATTAAPGSKPSIYNSNGGSLTSSSTSNLGAAPASSRPATGGPSFTQTAPLKLSSNSASLIARAPLTAPNPSATGAGGLSAPRLAVLMQGGGGGAGNVNGTNSATNGVYAGYTGGQNEDVPSSVRSSASTFAASRARNSGGIPAVNNQPGITSGTGVTVPAFLSASYAHPPTSVASSSSSNPSMTSQQPQHVPFTPATALYHRTPSNPSASAFASSGIATPHAHNSSGVIQWWVQEPKTGASANNSSMNDTMPEKSTSSNPNAASSTQQSSSSGAYPTQISTQSMMMFQKSRAAQLQGAIGIGSNNGVGMNTPQKSGSTNPLAANGINYNPYQTPVSNTATSLNSTNPTKLKSSVGAPNSASKAPSSIGKGSSSAAGFYSSPSNWSSNTFSQTMPPSSTNQISPYNFLSNSNSGMNVPPAYISNPPKSSSLNDTYNAPPSAYLSGVSNPGGSSGLGSFKGSKIERAGSAKPKSSPSTNSSVLSSASNLGLAPPTSIIGSSVASKPAPGSQKKKSTVRPSSSGGHPAQQQQQQQQGGVTNAYIGLGGTNTFSQQQQNQRMKQQQAVDTLYGNNRF